MLAGDVDAFANIPAPESLGQFEADPRFEVVIGSTEGETILTMNNGKPPFDDLRVRRAVAHALDREAIVDGAMFGYGTPIGSHFAPHHPAYVDLTGRYPHDPEKAKSLLAEAGLAEGFKATIKLPPPTYARRGGEIIAAQLAKVGIELEIVPVEWAQWLEQVFRGKDYDLTVVSHTEPMDINIYGRDDYYFAYESEAFKATLAKLDATVGGGRALRADGRGPAPDRRGLGQRLPVPARQARRLERQARGPLEQQPDPGQRPDRGVLERVTVGGRWWKDGSDVRVLSAVMAGARMRSGHDSGEGGRCPGPPARNEFRCPRWRGRGGGQPGVA